MVCASKIEGESTVQHTVYRPGQRVPVSKSELVLMGRRKIWFDFGHVVEASEKRRIQASVVCQTTKKLLPQ